MYRYSTHVYNLREGKIEDRLVDESIEFAVNQMTFHQASWLKAKCGAYIFLNREGEGTIHFGWEMFSIFDFVVGIAADKKKRKREKMNNQPISCIFIPCTHSYTGHFVSLLYRDFSAPSNIQIEWNNRLI